MSRRAGHGMLYLIIGIPLTALLMGIVTLFIAFSNPDPGVEMDGDPLSKTSWSRSAPAQPHGPARP